MNEYSIYKTVNKNEKVRIGLLPSALVLKYFFYLTTEKKMCEGCVFAVITVYQQSTGVCYQQVSFIDRCVSLRLHTFYWQW